MERGYRIEVGGRMGGVQYAALQSTPRMAAVSSQDLDISHNAISCHIMSYHGISSHIISCPKLFCGVSSQVSLVISCCMSQAFVHFNHP